MSNTSSVKRNANLELLRILSMIMVTFLHALGKADLLGNLAGSFNINNWLAWILEVLSLSAVNIFMLISGYFLINSEFKPGRLIEIVAQVLFYSAGSFIIYAAFFTVDAEEKTLYAFLKYLLPVHMEVYWFITAYVVIYMFLPVLSKGIKAITQKQFGTVIVLLLIYECVFKTLLPVRLAKDTRGYEFLWYLIVFMIGAYFRLYGFKHLTKPGRGFLLYFAGSFMILAETFALQFINTRFDRLKEITAAPTEYNHLFVLCAAVGIFSAFVNLKPMRSGAASVICALSPMALGVYLLQESITLRYRWQKWFLLPEAATEPAYIFLLKVFGAVLAMYLIGTAVDFVRIQLFALVRRIFVKRK
ncbi:MAG: acyltransferase [Lachnospiraceae bacterium]|nr:acyltransferase [Lachnospiraceae bacterium]